MATRDGEAHSGEPRGRRVAIACQGGGSHTAFTAGVLAGLLGSDATRSHEIVGVSGTSGGAVCALLAWSALVQGDGPRAGTLLEAFWEDNAATTPTDRVLNAWLLWTSRLQHVVATPAVSPYDNPAAAPALRRFRGMLERRVDFDRLAGLDGADLPMLLIGAVDVRSGEFVAFNSRRHRITADMVLASAAIPTLFRAVPVDGRLHWDGLFSQNPPVRELLDATPDELWVIQVNPRQRPTEPRTVNEIADRRNELAGNLSLHQELRFIEKINRLLDDGLLTPDGHYRPVAVRVIELTRSRLSQALGTTSKLNRDPSFIADLVAHGRARAHEFLAAMAFEDAWRSGDVDAVAACFADDAVVHVDGQVEVRGREAVREFVAQRLTPHVAIDVTDKQVCQARVVWSVRTGAAGDEAPRRGRAEATLRGDRIADLRLDVQPTVQQPA